MRRYILIFFVLIYGESYADAVLFHEKDAVVWHPEQVITGELSGFTAEQITVHLGDSSFSVYLTNRRAFSFQVLLRNTRTKIWAEVPHDNSVIVSDTLTYTLGYNPAPVIKPVATVTGNKTVLKAITIENPYKTPLEYLWMPDSLNPAVCRIAHKKDSVATVRIPNEPGTYFFNLRVISGEDSVWFQTMVFREGGGLEAFDINTDYPRWMDKAVIYEITPYSFVENGTFRDITAKLPELKSLGINTIWLQPVSQSYYEGQGYDVIDYLSVNPDLGTEKQLHRLIATAKALGLRVLFDVVLNHTSIHHPFAQDRIKYGVKSHYYNYYQHEKDGKPYSSYYDMNEHGFISYFWEDLVNLNYKNKEVQRWMLEVCKYWVREFDIDGYRFDAIWGVNARMPSFARRLRSELKSIKPDVLLLAEDKGSVPKVFKLGFDAAYDWTADTSWVSQWSWAYEYDPRKNFTIFNFPDADERGDMLRQALFHNGGNAHRKLRYIGNNDLPHFIQGHRLERTKMAAALLFSLPGIPMLYNGQEIGLYGHPYSIDAVFCRDSTIKSLDKKGLFSYYQKLIQLHKHYPALSGNAMHELPVSPGGAIVAFHRWKKDEHFIVVINMDSTRADARIDIRSIADIHSPVKKYRLRDVLSGDTFKIERNLAPISIGMKRYSVRWLLLENE